MNEYNDINSIPEAYKPLSMWQYFGYQILYTIPLIGFIFLLIHAFGGTKNMNLKNFARSYFCALIVFAVILCVALTSTGISAIFSTL